MVAPATTPAATRTFGSLLVRPRPFAAWFPAALTVAAFVILFANPIQTLWHDWQDPDNGHGLLLAPVAFWLLWREGTDDDASPNVSGGITLLLGALGLRLLGTLAAELFTQRISMWLAGVGMVVYCFGWRQARHWWLPLTMLLLSIPLPALITTPLALPLQFRASRIGTSLMRWRGMHVTLNGNVIDLPSQRLFVAEACSGLRSLTSLIALGVMVSGLFLSRWPSRVLLLLLAIPVAVLVNGVRIFLTGFLSYYIDPALGRGLPHEQEGWILFLVSMAILAGIAALLGALERRLQRKAAA